MRTARLCASFTMDFNYQQTFINNLEEQQPMDCSQIQTVSAMQDPSHGVLEPYDMFQDLQFMPDQYCSDQSARNRSNSTNFSSESSEDPEQMMRAIDTDPLAPLQDINISSWDFPQLTPSVMNMGSMQPQSQEELGNVQMAPGWATYPVNIALPCPNSVEEISSNQRPQEPENNNDFSYIQRLGSENDPKLELTVGFLSSYKEPMRTIDGEFLLFHEKTPDLSTLSPTCELIPFPNVDASWTAAGRAHKADGKKGQNSQHSAVEGKNAEKQKKYIERILLNMHGGLRVRCVNGCIYASRRSKARIYWKSYSTKSNIAMELPRQNEIMIFNIIEFKKRLTEIYFSQEMNHNKVRAINPAIYFVFGQKWSPESTPVNSTLVWAKLVPCSAQHMWDWLLHPEALSNSQKHKNMSDTSFHSGFLQMSEEIPGEQLQSAAGYHI